MSLLETPRLLLRRWGDEDEPALTAIFADGETMRYIGKGYPNGLAPEQAREALNAMKMRYTRDGIGIWPVVLKETGKLIGVCGLQPLPATSDVELAYIFDAEHRGKGYATEAASAVVDFGFRDRGFTRIVAVVHPFNQRSIALVGRLGMRFERVVRAYQNDVLKYVKERAP
ncbi:MAG: GNAT family N-acetyltransferase [Candidatus Eremiobacteraeota bacterium]|nr:GNAT family N-acetyltransferase [Candidatus Eremiobacteraeota bacterium]